MNTLDLNGRVAVITGGAQGIGRAVAQRMLGSGATVVLWDINEERLAQARVSLATLRPVDTVVVNVSDEASVSAATQRHPGATRPRRHPGQQRRHHRRLARAFWRS